MRDPFPYENCPADLRELLVPEPVSAARWESGLESWRPDGPLSLLEHLIREGVLTEDQFLLHGRDTLGLSLWEGPPPEPGRPGDPEQAMLVRLGYLPLGDPGTGGRLLAGGPSIPPDLKRDLGGPSGDWEWKLVSPVRLGRNAFAAVTTAAESESEAGSWMHSLLAQCTALDARDLHLERSGKRVQVRMRTPAGMQVLGEWNSPLARAGLRLLRRQAGLPDGGQALPADGRLTWEHSGQREAFRAGWIKTVDGESLVLRRLQSGQSLLPLKRLGLPEETREGLVRDLVERRGMVLCTGPTGSGKTTTAYALLQEVARHPLKILTIEDPVEADLPGVTQSAVQEAAGWSFERALRAFLRQDPDILFLGEIRDGPSATAACRAALTGHAVLATLHATDAASALQRLAAWNQPEGLIADTVVWILNQRLLPPTAQHRQRARFTAKRTQPEQILAFFRNGTQGANWP